MGREGRGDSFLSSSGTSGSHSTSMKLKDGAYSIVSGKYYESGPFDYNGGFYYVKATYKF